MNWLTAPNVGSQRVLVNDQEVIAINRNREYYTSLFCYDESMREHQTKNDGSVKGFPGPTYGHHFVIDFDGSNIWLVVQAMRRLFREINRLAIPYYLFYSGKKGFHLYIPKQYVEYPEELENQWHRASKLFATQLIEQFSELAKYVDFNCYESVRIFRYPYSVHPETGKRKVRYVYNAAADGEEKAKPGMTAKECKDAVGQIFVPADNHIEQTIKEIFHGVNDEPEEILMTLDLSYENKPEPPAPVETSIIPSNLEFTPTYNSKHCVYRMLNDHICHMKRHEVALRLQTYWREEGYPREYIEQLLRAWNAGLDPVHGAGPLEEKELQNVFKYADRYVYTCDDKIKREYCVPTCQMFKQKDLSRESCYFGKRYIESYLDALKEPTENYIWLNKVWPAFQSTPIKPDRGHVTVVAAGPSVGKTTLMLNLMLRYPGIKWLFMSYEMSVNDIVEKMWKIVMGDAAVTAHNIALFTPCVEHIVTWDDPTVYVTSIKDVWKMVRAQNGITCKAIIIDYLQLIPVKGSVATERAIAVAKALKELAKQLKVAVFLLSQVPKEMAGEGNEPLPMQAPKDSGEITNLADKQINCWRPNRARYGCVDDVFTVYMAKDRHGRACYSADLHFNGDRLSIENARPKPQIVYPEDDERREVA